MTSHNIPECKRSTETKPNLITQNLINWHLNDNARPILQVTFFMIETYLCSEKLPAEKKKD